MQRRHAIKSIQVRAADYIILEVISDLPRICVAFQVALIFVSLFSQFGAIISFFYLD